MRAVLLILIPMLVLCAVMTAVFWLSGKPGADTPPAPYDSQVADAQPAPVEKTKKTDTPPKKPPPKPATRAAVKPLPATAPRPVPASARAVAEAVDDLVNINRARRRRDRGQQLSIARKALASNKPAPAIAACDRILSAHPDDVDALSIKAEALVRMERFAEAADAFKRAVQNRPDDVRLRYNHAVVLSRLERFGEAIRSYEAILERQPQHAKAMYNLAVILHDEGKLTDAAALWSKITEVNPNLASAWFKRGVVAMQLGDHETALKAFSQADKLEPNRADTRTNLGIAHQELGHLAEAIVAYQRAREVDPKYLPAVNGFAEAYLRYYESNPQTDEPFELTLSWCEYSLRLKANQPRLRGLFQRALRARPGSVGAMNGLARVLITTPANSPQYTSDRARAFELCQKSLEAKPDQPDVTALLKRLRKEAP